MTLQPRLLVQKLVAAASFPGEPLFAQLLDYLLLLHRNDVMYRNDAMYPIFIYTLGDPRTPFGPGLWEPGASQPPKKITLIMFVKYSGM